VGYIGLGIWCVEKVVPGRQSINDRKGERRLQLGKVIRRKSRTA